MVVKTTVVIDSLCSTKLKNDIGLNGMGGRARATKQDCTSALDCWEKASTVFVTIDTADVLLLRIGDFPLLLKSKSSKDMVERSRLGLIYSRKSKPN